MMGRAAMLLPLGPAMSIGSGWGPNSRIPHMTIAWRIACLVPLNQQIKWILRPVMLLPSGSIAFCSACMLSSGHAARWGCVR